MNGPDSYSEAARLLDGLAEWTSMIEEGTPVDYTELVEGMMTAFVAFGHAMQANTAAVIHSGQRNENGYGKRRVAWEKVLTDG